MIEETKSEAARIASASHVPAIRADDPWLSSARECHQLFTEEERAQLSPMVSVLRFKKGAQIYPQGTSATAVFNIVSGVVKAYRTAADGSDHIVAFLFPDDLFGLAEEGKYANSTKALTPVTVFQIPVAAFKPKLARDPSLEFHLICKLCQELRQAQQHSLLLVRRRAVAKLGAFLQLLEAQENARGERGGEIYLPINRSEIGEYLGMSLEAVSRAFRTLTTRGIVKCRDRRHLKIADRSALKAISN